MCVADILPSVVVKALVLVSSKLLDVGEPPIDKPVDESDGDNFTCVRVTCGNLLPPSLDCEELSFKEGPVSLRYFEESVWPSKDELTLRALRKEKLSVDFGFGSW